MAKSAKRNKRGLIPTAAHLLAEFEQPASSDGAGKPPEIPVGNGFASMEPDEGDAPVGMLTDAQLGNRIRLVCARGYAALVFPANHQLYLRVIRPDAIA